MTHVSQIKAQLTAGLAVKISNGRHEWYGDEPVQQGGSDTGPNPYELLLGSLAACTCITVAAYCEHKGLPLQSITTTYDFARVHAEDCKHCDDDAEGLIDQISSKVHIIGDFSDAQRRRLAQITERCPVHKTLARGVDFDDEATFG